MNNRLLTVSFSPHTFGDDSVRKIMYGVIIAMIPAFAVSVYFFGFGALRVTLIAVISALLFEWLIQKYLLKGEISVLDGSAVITGMLLAFNVPGNLPLWMIITGSLVAISIGKMSFGGLGNNPFNPALVGRVFLLISFPVEMTSWPKVKILDFSMVDAQTGATPLSIVKEGLNNGESFTEIINQLPVSYMDMFTGNMGGSLGEISAIALIAGFIFMMIKKIVTWHIPVSMLGSIVIFAGILHLVNPESYADPLFHILSGGILLGAFFMATDMVTSPMTTKGMLVFGTGIGVITVLIRIFGAYPEGVSFAILIMNAFVPLLNNAFKPKRFGEIQEDNK